MTALAHYRKALTALIGAVITWAGAAYVPDGHVTRPEWFALALGLATAAGVYGVANGNQPAPALAAEHPSLGSAPFIPETRRTNQ